LRKYNFEYLENENNCYYNPRKIIKDFLILHLKISNGSNEYLQFKEKIEHELDFITHELLTTSILTPYNTRCYKINRINVSEYLPLLAISYGFYKKKF